VGILEESSGEFPKMKYPLVSIIIVNWDGRELLAACLNSLSKITYPKVEIIVVDNGSKDGSVDYINGLTKLRINGLTIKKILNKENLGFAEGNNIGLRQAEGEYVLLLNNDTEVEPDFLEPLIEEMEINSKAAVVQPKIIFSTYKKLQAGGSFFTSSGILYPYGFFKDPDDPKYNQKMKIFSANGACMLIKKEVIEKAKGLFDDDFFAYFEETDFCWRVILAGYEVLYEPKSLIYHKGRQTSLRLASGLSQYLSFRNRLCSILRNLSFKELIKILPVHIFISSIWMFAFLFLGKFSCVVSIYRAYMWNIINIKKTLEKRKIVQEKIRKINDKTLMIEYKKTRPISDYFLFFYKIGKYKG